jgi:hypothetical protein
MAVKCSRQHDHQNEDRSHDVKARQRYRRFEPFPVDVPMLSPHPNHAQFDQARHKLAASLKEMRYFLRLGERNSRDLMPVLAVIAAMSIGRSA